MRAWWRGTTLVAERGLVENLRSRSFKALTGLLLLLSIAAVTIPQILGAQGTTYTLATIGKAPAGVVATLDAAGKPASFTFTYVSRLDEAAVRKAVRDGDATAGLAGGTLYTSATSAGTFPVVVAQAVVTLETARQLSKAGLGPRQVADLQSIRAPKQVIAGPVDNAGRVGVGVGVAVGIVLYLALMLAGTAIATTVAMEKSTRISEVLLAILRPSQVLVGTVMAVGTATLVQLLVLATPLAVAVRDGQDRGPRDRGRRHRACGRVVRAGIRLVRVSCSLPRQLWSTRSPRSTRPSCRSRRPLWRAISWPSPSSHRTRAPAGASRRRSSR
jgi:ABC-2 type transport system permease protein